VTGYIPCRSNAAGDVVAIALAISPVPVMEVVAAVVDSAFLAACFWCCCCSGGRGVFAAAAG